MDRERPTFTEKFRQLKEIFSQAAHLRGIRRLLGWDQETYMPGNGQENRAEQNALLSEMIHERITSRRTGGLVEELFEAVSPKVPENDHFVCLREWKRTYNRQARLPSSLVKELARQSVIAHKAWAEARRSTDFSLFKPVFKRLVQLSRQKAMCLGFEHSPYDALLDEYEPGTTAREINGFFSDLVPPLQATVYKIAGHGTCPPPPISGRFPIEAQRVLVRLAATALGYNPASGRIDTVLHPFSTRIGPGDCRITTRWSKSDFTEAFFAVLHETGHAVYSQNLPKEHYGTPLGESVSMGIHESQSRFYENIVGRSRHFWKYFFPIVKGMFPGEIDHLGLDGFLKAINRVRPYFIRVEADEVTYNLHVYLRFVIERELIEGKLEPGDVPDRWNSLFMELFSLEVPDDGAGCLQDVHWSGASFGYFPTYTLGNIYAAMFLKALRQDFPGLESAMEAGDFSPVFHYLKENIHRHGQRYRPVELLGKVTGDKPSAAPLVEYIDKKYSELYC